MPRAKGQESGTIPPDLPDADNGAAEGGEGEVDVGATAAQRSSGTRRTAIEFQRPDPDYVPSSWTLFSGLARLRTGRRSRTDRRRWPFFRSGSGARAVTRPGTPASPPRRSPLVGLLPAGSRRSGARRACPTTLPVSSGGHCGMGVHRRLGTARGSVRACRGTRRPVRLDGPRSTRMERRGRCPELRIRSAFEATRMAALHARASSDGQARGNTVAASSPNCGAG